ncbi:MAG: type II CRISPR RNA-guided endonuclease Cas9 [Candidatus Ancillula sp.]|jgi:CRISPR-associated endonuclease Csn1|nr:type II CRISPR RNA-guided endonuclease Cas9 [Candidatus Ancillula sp.]
MAKNKSNLKDNQDYYIGLDCGSASVGWAVTDTSYKVVKINGKSAWGSRLFEEGQTAAGHRTNRSARLRYKRRNKRMRQVREIFEPTINSFDPDFFTRLDESKYWKEDKSYDNSNGHYTLFNDGKGGWTDKKYYNKYPTIFHLRYALMSGKNAEDVDARHYFLAINQIMKHRGHFLQEGKKFDLGNEINELFLELGEVCSDADVVFNEFAIEDIKKILLEKRSKTDRKKQLKEFFEYADEYAEDKDSKLKPEEIAGLLAGSTVQVKNLMNQKDSEETAKFDLNVEDERLEEIKGIANEFDEIGPRIINVCKLIVDWATLSDLLGENNESISKAMIDRFQQHKKDRKVLKELFKKYLRDKERNKFWEGTYAQYCGQTHRPFRNKTAQEIKALPKGKDKRTNKPLNQADFNKEIRKIIEGVEKLDVLDEFDKDIIEQIKPRLEENEFLPKQKGIIGRSIPMQIHRIELIKICENAIKNNILSDDQAKRIIELFEFRIPYYVGHLNWHQTKGILERQQPWVVFNDGVKPDKAPSTFDELNSMVDKSVTAEVFIKRMTNKCTYLPSRDVLAKNSIIYSEFTLLNELNNIKVNGDRISAKDKLALFEDLYVRQNVKSLTKKRIEKWFKENNRLGVSDVEIGGINDTIKGNMSSLEDMRKLGWDIHNTQLVESFDQIVEWAMLLKESKEMLEQKLKDSGFGLSKENIDKICKFSYSGWGNLSRKLLVDLHIDVVNLRKERLSLSEGFDTKINILDALKYSNYNFMELLAKGIGFDKKIHQFNADDSEGVEISWKYETVDSLYCSPSVKKMIWQAMKVVKEIVDSIGHEPKKIMIEMAREVGEKGNQKSSRKSQIQTIYKSIKGDLARENYFVKVNQSLLNREDSDLNAKNLYLYYMQMGKCAYCGKDINEEDLFNSLKTDRDHIYPRSKTKDDSITNNLVLVHKEHNSKKSDEYPLSAKIRTDMALIWKTWKDNGLITSEKYQRLVRSTELTDDELNKFVNRQLVDTRQSTKALAGILEQLFADTDIVYVKAPDVSEFRQKYDIVKVRDLNNLHHAKDAYLNIVVGNVLHERFTKRYFSKNKIVKLSQEKDWSLNFHTIFGEDKHGISKKTGKEYDFRNVTFSNGDGELIWSYQQTRSQVISQASKNDVIVSNETRKNNGQLFDLTLYPKGKNNSTGIKIKASDKNLQQIEKYGQFSSIKFSELAVVDMDNGDRVIRGIPLMYDKREKIADLEKYLEGKVICRLPLKSLLVWNGYRMNITGEKAYKNGYSLTLGKKQTHYLKRVIKYSDKMAEAKTKKYVILSSKYDKISSEQNIKLYDKFCEIMQLAGYKNRPNSQGQLLLEHRDDFVSLDINNQVYVLFQVLKLFNSVPGANADLLLIGGKGMSGANGAAFKISDANSCLLIQQSVTGLFEKRIDLKTYQPK